METDFHLILSDLTKSGFIVRYCFLTFYDLEKNQVNNHTAVGIINNKVNK